MTEFLFDGPPDAAFTILLAHGAGAPMDSAAMNAATDALVRQGIQVARFEFAYMASRRTEGSRKPPPKAEKLIPDYLAAVEALAEPGKNLIIGGKSMGGRVASIGSRPALRQPAHRRSGVFEIPIPPSRQAAAAAFGASRRPQNPYPHLPRHTRSAWNTRGSPDLHALTRGGPLVA